MISLGILESGKSGSIAMSQNQRVTTYSAMTKFHVEFVPSQKLDQENDKQHRGVSITSLTR